MRHLGGDTDTRAAPHLHRPLPPTHRAFTFTMSSGCARIGRDRAAIYIAHPRQRRHFTAATPTFFLMEHLLESAILPRETSLCLSGLSASVAVDFSQRPPSLPPKREPCERTSDQLASDALFQSFRRSHLMFARVVLDRKRSHRLNEIKNKKVRKEQNYVGTFKSKPLKAERAVRGALLSLVFFPPR